MKSFNRECVSIEDVCEHNDLDRDEVMEEVSNSEVSFGSNGDTLVSGRWLESLLGRELDWGDYSNAIFVSLGS